MKALIVFYTRTGHTEQAARDIARGLESSGVDCSVVAADDRHAGEDIAGCEIVAVGSPTYGHRCYRLPARQVSRFMDSLSPGSLKGKVCGAFTVNAAIGGGKLVGGMERSLEELGGHVVRDGPVVKAGAPLSLWKGPDATASDVSRCEEFGRRLAEAAAER